MKDEDTKLAPAQMEFGDYQCNLAMSLAKKLKAKPRDIAQQLINAMDVKDVVSSLEIAGPGFINIRLSESFIKTKLLEVLRSTDGRLGITKVPTEEKKRIVVDYSSPNIAKEMHVVKVSFLIVVHFLSLVSDMFTNTRNRDTFEVP